MDNINLTITSEQDPSSEQAIDQAPQAADEIIPLSLECLGLVGGGEGASVV
jgi:hypothetical protein